MSAENGAGVNKITNITYAWRMGVSRICLALKANCLGDIFEDMQSLRYILTILSDQMSYNSQRLVRTTGLAIWQA